MKVFICFEFLLIWLNILLFYIIPEDWSFAERFISVRGPLQRLSCSWNLKGTPQVHFELKYWGWQSGYSYSYTPPLYTPCIINVACLYVYNNIACLYVFAYLLSSSAFSVNKTQLAQKLRPAAPTATNFGHFFHCSSSNLLVHRSNKCITVIIDLSDICFHFISNVNKQWKGSVAGVIKNLRWTKACEL